ncbi:MAG: hypothetical protein ACK4ZW_12090 [Blastomonas sp.]
MFFLFYCVTSQLVEPSMKSNVSGVAGTVRIKNITNAGLGAAERHGKRKDKSSDSRRINSEPPLTTTGLDLRRLYKRHIEGAFVPKSRSQVMHLLLQFPTELVDGKDPAYMLHHAREFAISVFGEDAVFADRVDRDEKSEHVVDLFVVPKYVKRTKHQEKIAVAMSRDLKILAERYGRPINPNGMGRALQDALLDYLQGRMGLAEAQRGSLKQMAGSDWKSAEELRAQELDAEKQQLAAMRQELVGREALIVDRENQAQATLNAALSKLAEADQLRSELASDRLEAVRQMEAARQEALEVEKRARDVAAAKAAADAAKAEADRLIAEIQSANLEAEMARLLAKQDADAAKEDREAAERHRITAAAAKDAIVQQRQEIEVERALHLTQLELLERAADDKNRLNLSAGQHPTQNVGFVMDQQHMTQADTRAYLSPWPAWVAAFARQLVSALETARRLAASLLDREKAVLARDIELKAKMAEADRNLETQRKRAEEHTFALAELKKRADALKSAEAAVESASVTAIAKSAAAEGRMVLAKEDLQQSERWARALVLIDENPKIIVIGRDGSATWDGTVAKKLGPDFAETFALAPQMPEWAKSALGNRLTLAERMHSAAAAERKASEIASELQALMQRAGPLLNQPQRILVDDVQQVMRRANSLKAARDDREV